MQMALTGAAFSQCTACSPAVVGALRGGGWPWLLSALRVRARPITASNMSSCMFWPGTNSLAARSPLGAIGHPRVSRLRAAPTTV